MILAWLVPLVVAMADLSFTKREWILVYRVALSVLRAHDQAEDAAQDALLRAYRARGRFSGTSKPDSWLYRIAHNTALSHLRRPHIRRRSQDDVSAHQSEREMAGETPETCAMFGELAERLDECMQAMRPDDRLAFTERFLLGTSEAELGELLGVTANAAKQRAFRARRFIREHMATARAA